MQTKPEHINLRARRYACQILAATFLAFTGCSDIPTGPGQTDVVPTGGASFSHAASTGFTTLDLGTLGGSIGSAEGINTAGHIVGGTLTAAGAYRAFLWQDGVMTDLGTLNGQYTSAHGINDAGQVVGVSGNSAFLWQDGVMTDLGTLGGASSRATAINSSGHVVGQSEDGVGYRAFLWDGVAMRNLGTLGGNESLAEGINVAGQVVGRSSNADGHTRAFLWVDEGGLDLTPKAGPVIMSGFPQLG